MFDFSIEVNNIQLKPPRRGDEWLMVKFWEVGFETEDLIILNRVRIHQQVVFLSDVMDAGGRKLDKKYLTKRSQGENWSTLRFPVERPPRAHFSKWKEALYWQLKLALTSESKSSLTPATKLGIGDWMRRTRILPGRDCYTLKVR